jgi:hypothetical protein
MTGALATLCSLGGLALLYLSWRGTWPARSAPARLAAPAGWLLQVVAAVLWVQASNIEFGLAYALLVPALGAWALAVFNHEIRAGRQRTTQSGQITLPGAGTLGRQTLRLLAAVPLSGAAAAVTSIALTTMLPWSQTSQLSTGMLVMPLLWGAASVWVCADPRPWRPVLALLIALLLSVLFLYV